MILLDSLFLIALICFPFICHYVNKILEVKKLSEIKKVKYDSLIKFNHIFFYVILSFLSVYSIFIYNTHIFEPLLSAFYIYICTLFFGSQIYNLYNNLHNHHLVIKIVILLSIPIMIMTSIRDFFDTYRLGLWVFNLSDFIIFAYEIIFIVFINLAYLFINTYENKYMFVGYLFGVFMAILLFFI
jgi:hypothetical protein